MKMIRKHNIIRTIILISVLFTAVAMKADNVPGIVISQFDKVETQKAISAIGRLEVDGDQLWLVSKTGERLGSYPIITGLRISVEEINDETTDIRTIVKGNVSIRFSGTADVITINGLDHPTTVRIYSMSGRQQTAVPLQANRTQQVDASSLQAGVYILQIDTTVFKLFKK